MIRSGCGRTSVFSGSSTSTRDEMCPLMNHHSTAASRPLRAAAMMRGRWPGLVLAAASFVTAVAGVELAGDLSGLIDDPDSSVFASGH